MPILAKTPQQAVDQFRNVLAALLAQVLHEQRVVRAVSTGSRFYVGILDEYGAATPVRLKRPNGASPLFLSIWQQVQVVEDEGSRGRRAFRPQTLEYNYHLSTGVDEDPLLRWEYVKHPKGGARYCRHHLQGRVALTDPVNATVLDFKKMHVPTSYMLLEDVLRFVIIDLEHKPPCGKKWNDVLEASRKKFFEELSSRPQHYSPAA